jgi:hypothetical protein
VVVRVHSGYHSFNHFFPIPESPRLIVHDEDSTARTAMDRSAPLAVPYSFPSFPG